MLVTILPNGNVVMTVSGRSAVSKVADILRFLEDGRSCTLTELAHARSLPMSTAYRIVNELVSSDILSRTEHGYYVLQPWRAGSAAENPEQTPSPRGALSTLDDLGAVTSKVVRLATHRRGQVRYVERVPSHAEAPYLERIDLRPLHASATGKVLLAFRPKSVLDVFVAKGLWRCTRHTVTDAAEFLAGLARTRRTGLAYDWGEFDEDVSAVAVPVFGPGLQLVAALELQVTGEADSHRLEQAALVAARTLGRQFAAEWTTRPRPAPVA